MSTYQYYHKFDKNVQYGRRHFGHNIYFFSIIAPRQEMIQLNIYVIGTLIDECIKIFQEKYVKNIRK